MITTNPDSAIVFEHQGMFNDIPACYQTWRFDDFSGESIVFKKSDIKKQLATKIIKQIRASKLAQTHKPITISHNPPGHLCVIFNFEKRPK